MFIFELPAIITASGPTEVVELSALPQNGPKLLNYFSSVQTSEFYFVLLFPIKLSAFAYYKSKSIILVSFFVF